MSVLILACYQNISKTSLLDLCWTLLSDAPPANWSWRAPDAAWTPTSTQSYGSSQNPSAVRIGEGRFGKHFALHLFSLLSNISRTQRYHRWFIGFSPRYIVFNTLFTVKTSGEFGTKYFLNIFDCFTRKRQRDTKANFVNAGTEGDKIPGHVRQILREHFYHLCESE
jgi:hypothetical protein